MILNDFHSLSPVHIHCLRKPLSSTFYPPIVQHRSVQSRSTVMRTPRIREMTYFEDSMLELEDSSVRFEKLDCAVVVYMFKSKNWIQMLDSMAGRGLSLFSDCDLMT